MPGHLCAVFQLVGERGHCVHIFHKASLQARLPHWLLAEHIDVAALETGLCDIKIGFLCSLVDSEGGGEVIGHALDDHGLV